MSDAEAEEDEPPKKGGKMGLILGLVGGLLVGGGAFFAIYSGMILAPGGDVAEVTTAEAESKTVSFVVLDPMTVSLGQRAQRKLRFQAQLEVDPAHSSEVAHLMPRILDILNGFLRAVDLGELEDPASLIRLRAQMLRRVQLVTGKGYVRDLLITEFIFL